MTTPGAPTPGLADDDDDDACTIVRLTPAHLEQARELLRVACLYERAAEVAEEKLFDPALEHPAHALAAIRSGHAHALLGLAVVSGPWLRLLAVAPARRGQGVGSALLSEAEAMIRRAGHARVRVMDQPGNYLAPGIDRRDHDTIAWLLRRGYHEHHDNTNLVVALEGNPQVSEQRSQALRAAVPSRYVVRRARASDREALTAMVRETFSAAWADGIARALALDPPAVHIALEAGQIIGFAAHDSNNRGLGWFGPAGTLPGHRGSGLGRVLLLACLMDVARAGHRTCEVAWIGPRVFYERSVGIIGERRFAVLHKELLT